MCVQNHKKPELTPRFLLFKNCISKNEQRVYHLKRTWLGESIHKHPEIAKDLTVANKYLVYFDCVSFTKLSIGEILLLVFYMLPRLAWFDVKVVIQLFINLFIINRVHRVVLRSVGKCEILQQYPWGQIRSLSLMISRFSFDRFWSKKFAFFTWLFQELFFLATFSSGIFTIVINF